MGVRGIHLLFLIDIDWFPSRPNPGTALLGTTTLSLQAMDEEGSPIDTILFDP